MEKQFEQTQEDRQRAHFQLNTCLRARIHFLDARIPIYVLHASETQLSGVLYALCYIKVAQVKLPFIAISM